MQCSEGERRGWRRENGKDSFVGQAFAKRWTNESEGREGKPKDKRQKES